jgi:hypothetical protein
MTSEGPWMARLPASPPVTLPDALICHPPLTSIRAPGATKTPSPVTVWS